MCCCRQALVCFALPCSAGLRVADVWLVISFNEKQTRRIRNAAILSRSSNKFTAQQLPEATLRRAANSKMANNYTKLLTHTHTHSPREYNWISMPEWLKINFMHRTKSESDSQGRQAVCQSVSHSAGAVGDAVRRNSIKWWQTNRIEVGRSESQGNFK